MTLRDFAALALAFCVPIASAATADERPPLKGVSAARVANYGAPSVLVKERDEVRAVVEELSTLRNKAWRRGDMRLSCYSTVLLLVREKTQATFRVTPDYIVERPMEKGQSSYTLAIGASDLPTLTKLLAEAPPTRCGK